MRGATRMHPAYQKGMVLYRQQRYRQAVEQFREALAASPGAAPAHAMLALSLLNDKQIEPAYNEAAEALRLSPTYAFGHYAMAYVLLSRPTRRKMRSFRFTLFPSGQLDERRRRVFAARKSVKRALQVDPYNPDFLEFLAHLEGSLGRWQLSLEAADRGLASNARHVPCANRRAMALHQLGRTDQAKAEIDRALTIDPEHAITHRNRGWVLLQAGDYVAARDHFSESLRVNPLNRSAKVGLSNARACAFPPYRWLVRFVLWSNLAAMRPYLAIAMGASGVTAACLRDHGYSWVAVIPLAAAECIAVFLLVYLMATAVRFARRFVTSLGRPVTSSPRIPLAPHDPKLPEL
jgi:tetratricopeptide (TPR) repeat protein